MRINSGGNVGIGTTGPLTKLDVRGSTFVSGYLAGFDTSPQGNYAYRLTNDGANSFINVLGGNLGIGTTSPKTTLDITGSGNTAINSKGNLLVSSGGTATQVAETGGQISFGSWLNGDLTQPYPLAAIRGVAESSTTNNNRGALIFGTMDSNTTVQERMRIDSSGYVNIKQKQNSGLAYDILINLGTSPDGKIAYQTQDQLAANLAVNANSNWIKTGNNIYNSNSANVGIGTTSPGAKLDVVGSGKFQPGIADGDALVTIAQTNTNAYVHAGIKINAGNTNPFYIYQSGSSNTLRFNYNSLADAGGQLVITDSGNVGIGTASPTMKLHIAESKAGNIGVTVQNTNSSYSSQIRFLNSVGTEKSALTFVPSDTSLRFFHNGSDRMTITSGGQVTIGTTNTAALLNVGGPILASDNNQSSGMYVRRTLNLTHPGNTGTFTRTFNPVTQFGISRLGGNVLLEVSGWSQKVNCGYIQFQNAGGGGNLTTVSYTQIAVSGTGSISVSINSANDNSIDINFSGWHGNSHAWQAKIITQ